MQDTSATPTVSAASHRAPRWQQVAQGAGTWADGGPAPIVFETMTALAQRTDALNLGQGFPDVDGPAWVRRLAAEALVTGEGMEFGAGGAALNQYAPGPGMPVLREAIVQHQRERYGLELDAGTEVLITTGATEGIAAALLSLLDPGDEAVVLEPFYDSYAGMIAMAGATQVTVPLTAPDFLPDPAAVEAAFTPRTRVLVLNSPHNPTGTVAPRPVLHALVDACARHDVVILSDEVYEHLVFEGEHVPVATLPGAAERTLTVSSAGKSLSLTGWKIGWLTGPAELVMAARQIKQFLTFCSGPAFQVAVAQALRQDRGHFTEQRARLQSGRDVLVEALRQVGLDPVVPAAGYFTVVDLAPWGVQDVAAEAEDLARRMGVVGIPVSGLCRPGTPTPLRSWLRLAFCKRPEVVQEAARRITTGGQGASETR